MLTKNHHYFQIIAEYRSITRAAEKLYISQPSLSKYLKRLEENLGVELIDHNSSPLVLTYAGERYLEHIKQVQHLERQLKNDFTERATQHFALVRMGITPWHSTCILPGILRSLKEAWPNVRVDLSEQYSDVLFKLLLTGQIDFCILMQPYDIMNVTREVIMRQRIIAAIHRDNPILARLEPIETDEVLPYPLISVHELHGETLILPKQSHVFAQYISSLLEDTETYMPVEVETESFSTNLGLVASNLGVTFLLDGGHQLKRYHDDIAFFVVDSPKKCDLCIAYKNKSTLDRHTLSVIEHIKQYCGAAND